jgi:hypothetical protein
VCGKNHGAYIEHLLLTPWSRVLLEKLTNLCSWSINSPHLRDFCVANNLRDSSVADNLRDFCVANNLRDSSVADNLRDFCVANNLRDSSVADNLRGFCVADHLRYFLRSR